MYTKIVCIHNKYNIYIYNIYIYIIMTYHFCYTYICWKDQVVVDSQRILLNNGWTQKKKDRSLVGFLWYQTLQICAAISKNIPNWSQFIYCPSQYLDISVEVCTIKLSMFHQSWKWFVSEINQNSLKKKWFGIITSQLSALRPSLP